MTRFGTFRNLGVLFLCLVSIGGIEKVWATPRDTDSDQVCNSESARSSCPRDKKMQEAPGAVPYDRTKYNENHLCHFNPDDLVCQRLDELRNPVWSESSDLYIVPHRGLWGTDNGAGPPENSQGAVSDAVDNGYLSIEIDAMNTEDAKLVGSHDYPLLRLTNSTDPDAYVFNQTQDALTQLLLRRRDTTVSDEHMMTTEWVLQEMLSTSSIVMIDGKEQIGEYKNGQCVAYCGDDTKGDGPSYPDYEHEKGKTWMQIVSNTLSVAEEVKDATSDATKTLIVKTYYLPETLINGGGGAGSKQEPFDGLGYDDMTRILWVPMIISSRMTSHNYPECSGLSQEACIAYFVNQWCEYAETTAYIETDYKAYGDTMLETIVDPGNPDSAYENCRTSGEYSNTLTFIKAKLGRRSGIFTDDPVGRRGVVTRWSDWKMKDPTTDLRADPMFVLSQDCAQFMVITSDNPYSWGTTKDVLPLASCGGGL